jgi:uncharacterized protein YkwD
MYERPVRAAVVAALVCFSLSVPAQDAAAPPPASAADGSTTRGKAAIRHPGNSTASQGGVGLQSRPELPADAGVVRSPAAGNAAQDGTAQRDAAAEAELDALQAPVLARVNYHRALAGLAPVAAEPRLLKAAQSHSSYLDSANQMGHYEDQKANPYYTGNSPFDRIDAVHYDYAEAGEVVAHQPSSHPAGAVDALVTAIYHRFIILSVDFVQAGPGVSLKAHQGTDELNITVDFGAETLPPAPPPSMLTVYPAVGQTGVPPDFDPAEESPNPMPGHTLVGYPISIQVDARHAFAVESFQLYELGAYAPRRALDAKLLTHEVDAETPAHAAALIPVSPLAPATVHQVVFTGSVNKTPVSMTWQFMTAPESVVTMKFASPSVAPGGIQQIRLDGLDSEKGPYYLCYSPARLVRSLVHETETQIAVTTSNACDPDASCQVSVSASYRSCAKPFASGTFTIAQ